MLNGVLLKRENLKGEFFFLWSLREWRVSRSVRLIRLSSSISKPGEVFEETVLTEIMKQTPKIQKAIYKGELADDDTVIDYLMCELSSEG